MKIKMIERIDVSNLLIGSLPQVISQQPGKLGHS